MKGHGTQFGRKKEAAIAALLTARNFEEAAKTVGIAPNTLLNIHGCDSEYQRTVSKARMPRRN